ncbi:MAG: cyclic nucleotide-binding domain-containing protein [Proteobacteria bacterium]|nr:cyclic nucleotide-binding domain-containing protein [Pseudomonadota bacterium]
MTDSIQTVAGSPAPSRTRPLAEIPALAEMAARLLRTPSALAEMADDDARHVVSYMRLIQFAAGAPLFRAGDMSNTSYLLLVLSGEVKVEAADVGTGETMDIAVLGPGNVIGEMGLIDGEPRSANCTAVDTVQAAGLSRRALDVLIAERPAVAAKLMVALTKRLADRLRALGDQLVIYARLAHEARAETARLRGSPRG